MVVVRMRESVGVAESRDNAVDEEEGRYAG